MTEILEPQPGESIYDPTCGSGGMLLSCITHLRRRGLEWRNVRLFGQERNLMTSSIARMNCFLHGIEDFQIVRGDTLSEPKFVQGDRLMTFDVVLANPPYSIKQWDREVFSSDPWGRNLYGTPPQGRADYAFWQHILCSLASKSGRCAILFPHGVLFRKEESEMRQKLIETDLIDCVVGLGPNLFYNSAMEACIVVCRASKPKARRGRILLIQAANEVIREKAQSYLTSSHIERIVATYRAFQDEPGFSCVLPLAEARKQSGNLNILLHLKTEPSTSLSAVDGNGSLAGAFATWLIARNEVRESLQPVLRKPTSASGTLSPSQTRLQRPVWVNDFAWKKLRLGDLAVRAAETIESDDPAVYRWIAAEHIDESDIRVHRWSDTTDPLLPPTFRFAFKAGHILLHSRNPKKVVIPHFSGITGEKLFILESKDPGALRIDFLAFVLMSDYFKRWASKWLSGSVNKFLNWSALERLEVAVPPLETQQRISEILWATDDARVEIREAYLAMEQLRTSRLLNLYRRGIGNGNLVETALGPRPCTWEVSPLGKYYDVQLGKMLSPKALAGTAHRPYLRNANVQWNRLDLSDVATMSFTEREAKKFELKKDDILAFEGRHVGKAAIWRGEIPGACYQKALHRLRARDIRQVPEFLLFQMEHHSRVGLFANQTRETTIPHLPAERLREIPFSFPPIDEQKAIVDEINTITAAASALRGQMEASARLLSLLIDDIAIGDSDGIL
jgi:type I restriction enzyme M protein